MIRLVLKPGRTVSVERRHPWLFSGAVAETQGDGSDGMAEVVAPGGQRLAAGTYSPGSRIVARLWTFGEEGALSAALVAERFAAARRLRQEVLPPETSGYRAVNSEGDRCPGVTLDVYGGIGVLELSAPATHAWEGELREAARRVFQLEQALVRRTGAEEDRSLTTPDAPADEEGSARVAFRENGVLFFADLASGQKTGFFLDQRENRSRLRALARGRRVLNLFSYTGAFSVAALAGGAARAVDVDASEPALALAGEHRRANGFASDPADFVRADVFEDLRRRVAAGESWDAVVCDPPAFAKKSRDVERAARGYKDVNRLAMRLLRPGGILLTCSCSGAVDPTLFQQIVFAAQLESGSELSLFARQGAGPDHPISLDCPEGEYLKGLWFKRSG